VVRAEAHVDKPTLETLRSQVRWRLGLPGTCSPTHFRRIEFEKIGTLAVDREKVARVFPGLRPGIAAAAGDISIANYLSSVPFAKEWAIPKPQPAAKGRAATIIGIDQILTSES
jgi:hypothetical protein